MKYFSNFHTSVLFFCFTLLSYVLYRGVGSHIAFDGTLVEPFYLIPITWICLFVAILTAVIGAIKTFKKKINKGNQNLKNIILIIVGVIVGILWQQFTYTDICLDMGGGKNPGGYPICVLQK